MSLALALALGSRSTRLLGVVFPGAIGDLGAPAKGEGRREAEAEAVCRCALRFLVSCGDERASGALSAKAAAI
ncbi:hypothetical protein OsI_21836 [Oryza sativa Indica Group]|jgi:hypothetical protein|uniref:Uncharacterized protein n=1 Tax=Oryza sativa subsp. indica TaxID=39946 RepID=A2Y9T3_ORYSI|nr:hypothetical protein OsI_21836 [Oryza sativa Indica Group]